MRICHPGGGVGGGRSGRPRRRRLLRELRGSLSLVAHDQDCGELTESHLPTQGHGASNVAQDTGRSPVADLLRVSGVFPLGASGLLHDGGCGLVERGVGRLLSEAGTIVIFLEGNALEEEGAAVQMNVNQGELPE